MSKTKCEKCVFALWTPEDSSVGMQAYVEECKWKSSNFDDVSSGELDECLFFIEQLFPEYQFMRCPECYSSKIDLVCYHYCDITGNFKCTECNNVFVSDMPMN